MCRKRKKRQECPRRRRKIKKAAGKGSAGRGVIEVLTFIAYVEFFPVDYPWNRVCFYFS